jgi:hypothetical protein
MLRSHLSDTASLYFFYGTVKKIMDKILMILVAYVNINIPTIEKIIEDPCLKVGC